MKFDLGNLNKMMKQAQAAQSKMADVQASLAQHEVEASVGGGKVVVKATAAGDITGLKIDAAVIDPSDPEFLADLILTAIRQALEEGRKIGAAEMQKVTAGLGLPPGMGF
jgi:nucleoid-associated protein EbfC